MFRDPETRRLIFSGSFGLRGGTPAENYIAKFDSGGSPDSTATPIYEKDGNKIGIGTTGPESLLHLKGAVPSLLGQDGSAADRTNLQTIFGSLYMFENGQPTPSASPDEVGKYVFWTETKGEIKGTDVVLAGVGSTDITESRLGLVVSAASINAVTSAVNASVMGMSSVAGQFTSVYSNKTGSGSYLPMTFWTGGAERIRIETLGGVTFKTGIFAGTDAAYDIGASATRWMNVFAKWVDAANAFNVNGTQVVTSRQAAVSDVTLTAGASYGTNEQDMLNDLKRAINQILARLRTHGLIS